MQALPLVHGPSKTNHPQLSFGNAEGGTKVRALLSDSALALGPRSTGLGKMVQELRAGFYVAKWEVFSHPKPLYPLQASLI